jgi:hypothetical protein
MLVTTRHAGAPVPDSLLVSPEYGDTGGS